MNGVASEGRMVTVPGIGQAKVAQGGADDGTFGHARFVARPWSWSS